MGRGGRRSGVDWSGEEEGRYGVGLFTRSKGREKRRGEGKIKHQGEVWGKRGEGRRRNESSVST